jgi:hypothetical protein
MLCQADGKSMATEIRGGWVKAAQYLGYGAILLVAEPQRNPFIRERGITLPTDIPD